MRGLEPSRRPVGRAHGDRTWRRGARAEPSRERSGRSRGRDARPGRQHAAAAQVPGHLRRSTRPTRVPQEAAAELQNPTALDFTGPTADNSVGRPDRLCDQCADPGLRRRHAVQQCRRPDRAAPRPRRRPAPRSSRGTRRSRRARARALFVAQVDFDRDRQGHGRHGAAISSVTDGGKVAVLSASPDAANQNAWIAAYDDPSTDPTYANIEHRRDRLRQ